jgi:hypothetical protein
MVGLLLGELETAIQMSFLGSEAALQRTYDGAIMNTGA